MYLEQQRLIMIFVASLEMNPSALHGTSLDHDSLRGKIINQGKSIPFYFAPPKFWNSFNFQICYNLLSYRYEGFTGEYATRKIQTASRVAQASEVDEQHLRYSPGFVCVLPRRFREKTEIVRSLLKWNIFQVTSDDTDHIIYFPAFSRFLVQTVSSVYSKNNVT